MPGKRQKRRILTTMSSDLTAAQTYRTLAAYAQLTRTESI